MLENSLPKFLYEYLRVEETGKIELTFKDGCLISKIGGKDIKYVIPTVLDDIKETQSDNEKALVSVHEAGHAVLYALLFKTVPTQIVASTTNEYASGFVGVHGTIGAKIQYLTDVKITLGGRIAEEIVFGGDYISSGAAGDFAYATETISAYIRSYGFDDNIGTYQPLPKNNGSHKTNIEETDFKIETILRESYVTTKTILENNMDFLMDVAQELMEKTTLTPKEFQKIANKHMDSKIAIVSASKDLEVDYHKLLEDYGKKRGK
jgi:cell division protease FtsH